METFRRYLVRLYRKHGRGMLLLYALLFLLSTTFLLTLVFLAVGGLTFLSPHAVLILTAVPVGIIVYKNLKTIS